MPENMFNGKQIDLAAIIASLPEGIQAEVNKYAPALLDMTYEEIWGWIHLILAGKQREAYQKLISRLSHEDLLTEWATVNEAWFAANTKNANRIDTVTEAIEAILRAVMSLAVKLVLL